MDLLVIPILSLTPGTVKATDVYPAVDTTDTTQSPIGTTKKYTVSQLATFIGGGGTGGLTWNPVVGTSQVMLINNGYYTLNSATTLFTLPTTAVAGSVIRIAGFGTGGWSLDLSGGQEIAIGDVTAATSIASTNARDSIELLCVVANTNYLVISMIGNLTFS